MIANSSYLTLTITLSVLVSCWCLPVSSIDHPTDLTEAQLPISGFDREGALKWRDCGDDDAVLHFSNVTFIPETLTYIKKGTVTKDEQDLKAVFKANYFVHWFGHGFWMQLFTIQKDLCQQTPNLCPLHAGGFEMVHSHGDHPGWTPLGL
jgi:hypothetical protein